MSSIVQALSELCICRASEPRWLPLPEKPGHSADGGLGLEAGNLAAWAAAWHGLAVRFFVIHDS